jgi:hypothetical protein
VVDRSRRRRQGQRGLAARNHRNQIIGSSHRNTVGGHHRAPTRLQLAVERLDDEQASAFETFVDGGRDDGPGHSS